MQFPAKTKSPLSEQITHNDSVNNENSENNDNSNNKVIAINKTWKRPNKNTLKKYKE